MSRLIMFNVNYGQQTGCLFRLTVGLGFRVCSKSEAMISRHDAWLHFTINLMCILVIAWQFGFCCMILKEIKFILSFNVSLGFLNSPMCLISGKILYLDQTLLHNRLGVEQLCNCDGVEVWENAKEVTVSV